MSAQPAAQRPPGQALRFSEAPHAVTGERGGGIAFYAYCLGGETRAAVRRDSIDRAHAAHRRALKQRDSGYPTALILSQRIGVAFEDLARFALAFERLETGDPFERLRSARIDDFDDVFERLSNDAEALRVALRLPRPEDVTELAEPLREAVLAASDALTRRWHGHWRRTADGWHLMRRLAKGMRHGSPLIPREVVLEPPGAGALGADLADSFDRWVLLLDTAVDHAAQALHTTYVMADLSDATLSRGRQAGIEAVALARELAGAHVHRMRSSSRWAMSTDALKLVSPEQARILKEHDRD